MTETVAPDFWLCGPLRIRLDGNLTVLRPTLLHELLALLLLRANTPVPISDIAASLWPNKALQDEEHVRPYVSRVRRLLRGVDVRLTSLTRRYCLEVDPLRVDVLRFERLVTQADQTDDPGEQRRLVDEAMAACPTNSLLTDFTREWAHKARIRHQQRWDVVALRRNRYWLRDGAHERLLSVLRREKVQLSADQRWAEDYLLALYRNGLVQDAQAHYDALDQHLRRIGTPINERLRGIGDAIRRQDPALDQPEVRSAMVVSDILPPPVERLAGRHAEVRTMRAFADVDARDTIRVIGIFGPPGIGKTTLATAYAHGHKARYGGGALFADLGTHGATHRKEVDVVLGLFLGALGVGSDQIPPEGAARLDRYRDLVRRRRMLVVLDNVASTDDAAALLPTGPGSLVIVTSRTRLTALTSRYGALPIVLDRLDESASVMLLNRFVRDRPDHIAAVVNDIARACSGHPLALCLVGARLATRPEESLEQVAAALAEPTQRIPTMDRYAESGDAVAEVFGWSYRALDPEPARVFRTLGLSPCATLDLAAAAHLTGVDTDHLGPILSSLTAAHLLVPTGNGRHGMLDLLAEYAAALAADIDPPDTRQRALDRLLAYHREMARAAAHLLWPMEVDAVHSAAGFSRGALARQWLDDHRDDVLAAAHHEVGVAQPRHVIDLADCLFRYLDHGGYLDQAVRLARAALTAAQSLDDEAEAARALGRLGAIQVRRGQWVDAEDSLSAAHALYQHLGDRRGRAVALGNLGRVLVRRGAYIDAATHHQEALDLFRAVGDRLGEARTLTNLGIVCEARGDLNAALTHHEVARAICEAVDAPDALARALGGIAGVLRGQGRLDEAGHRYEDALERFRELGDLIGEATTLTNLGLVRSGQGRRDAACRLHEKALEIFEGAGDRADATETLNNLGAALLAAGRSGAASFRHREALSRATQAGDVGEAARAHAGLAAVHAQAMHRASGTARTDELAKARDHVQQATHRYGDLNIECPQFLSALADQLGAEGF